MKGVIFNLLERFVDETFGKETFEGIIGQCDLSGDGTFIAPGTYPDKDLEILIEKILELKNIPFDGALKAFGEFCFPHLAVINPAFVDPYDNAKDFIKTIEDVIHVEVRKLYPGAVTPKFTYKDLDGDSLEVKYESKRRFCFLMEGLLKGCAEHFKTDIEIQQIECMHSDDNLDYCIFKLKF